MVAEQVLRDDVEKAIQKEFHKFASLKSMTITKEVLKTKSNPHYVLSIETAVNETLINKDIEKYTGKEKYDKSLRRTKLKAQYAKDVAGRKQLWTVKYHVPDEHPPNLLKIEQLPCHRGFFELLARASSCVPSKAQVREILEASYNEIYNGVITVSYLTKFDVEPVSTFQAEASMLIKLKADKSRLDEFPDDMAALEKFKWMPFQQEWTFFRDEKNSWSLDTSEHKNW